MDSSNKTVLALGLFLAGLLSAAFAFTAFWFYSGLTIVVMIFGFAAVGLVVVASILGLTQIMDRSAEPVVEELESGLQDDWDDLMSGHFTWAHGETLISIIVGIIFALLILRFHKMDATWFHWLPVWIPAVIVAGFIAWVVSKTEWFNDHHFALPGWIYLIPLTGILISTLLGINNFEDVKLINPTVPASANSVGYNNYYPYHSYYFFNSSNYSSGGGSSVHMPACSGKSCEGEGILILIIVLIVVTIMLIVGSAFIPHFWFFAGVVFLTFLLLINIQKLLVRPYNRRKSQSYYP